MNIWPRLQPPDLKSLPLEGAEHMSTKTAPESLADYVRRTRHEKNLSQGDVERDSARRGNRIAGTYVSRIENEIATNPSPKKLSALALGLNVPEDEVFAAARGKSLRGPDAREERLLTIFRELPLDRQDDLLDSARSMHRRHGIKTQSIAEAKKRKQA